MGGSSGGGSSTTVQKADPWSGVQPYLTNAYGQANALYQPGQGPVYFPGSTVATPAANEAIGQNMMAGQAGAMGSIANGAQQNLQGMNAGGAWGQNMGINMGTAGAGGMQNIANQLQYGGIGADQALNAMLGQAGGVGQYGSTGADQSMNALLGYGANNTMPGVQGAYAAMGGLNAASDPQNNPYFQQAVQSAIRPVTQQFQEQVLPGIKQGAMGAGQMGGSRQGIAEGIAARGYQDTVGDITANMGNAAYAQGLQALQASGQLGANMAQMGLGATSGAGQLGQSIAGLNSQQIANAGQLGLGMANQAGGLSQGIGNLGSNFYGQGNTALGQSAALAGGVQQAQMAPGQMINQIGQQQTADQQAQLQDQVNRWNYQQNLPYTMISDYLSLLNGAQGGQTTAQQSGGGGSNRMMGALGGAGTGAAIGSAFAPGIGTAIGAGAGALYGLFM